MASLPTRTTASFAAIAPVPNLTVLDNEFNQYVGASGIFNGGTTGTKLLVKTSDAADPVIECDQVGAGPLAEWKQNGTLKVSIANSGQVISAVTTGTAPLSIASTTVVPNLNVDKVDGFDIVGVKTAWAASWFYPVPPAANEGVGQDSVGRIIVPEGGTFTIRKIGIEFAAGSHTAGGVLQHSLCSRAAPAGGDAAIATFPQLDNTNNTVNTLYTNDIGDINLTALDKLYVRMNGRSGTITELNITCYIWGVQTFNNL